jgi:hypothetical protein
MYFPFTAAMTLANMLVSCLTVMFNGEDRSFSR